jgi:hypothetical protein
MRGPDAFSVAAALIASAGIVSVASPARAQQLPQIPRSINAPPAGPGTAQEVGLKGREVLRPGMEASATVGTGFADTYGLGFEGRVGYTFRNGVYAGGAAQYFLGHSINDQQAHAAFVGGEIGYKIYPIDALEIRPYAFAGPAFITQVAAGPTPSSRPLTLSRADFGVQPGVVGMYHFGDAFVGADAHFMLLPAPNTLALLAGGGFGF